MSENNPQIEEKLVNLKDLKWIYKALIKGWYILIIMPLIIGFIGAFMSYKQTKVYTSQLQLLLESNETYDYQTSIYKSVGYQYTDISNQIRVLKSYDLIEKAVEKLDLNVTYYTVGRINTNEVFWGVPFKINLKSFSNQISGKNLKIEFISDEEFQIVFELDGILISNKHNIGEEVINKWYVLKLEVFQNVSTIQANYEVQFHNKSYWINKVKSGLDIVNQEYTSILNITLNDHIPERSQMILDTLAVVYLEYTLQSQFDINNNTLLYINKQLKEVTGLMDSISLEIDTLRDEKDVLDLNRETEVIFANHFKIENQIETLEKKIKSIKHLQNYIENSESSNLLPPSVYLLDGDQYLSKSLSEFYTNQLAKITMKTTVTIENQKYRSWRTKLCYKEWIC